MSDLRCSGYLLVVGGIAIGVSDYHRIYILLS
jgi:hypothetical protein